MSFGIKLLSGFLLISILLTCNVNAKELNCPSHILKEFRKYKNHKQLIAIAKKESSFNPKARNGSCWGLGQINYKIWTKELKKQNIIKNEKDLFKIKENIEAMDFILKHYKYSYRRYQGKSYK